METKKKLNIVVLSTLPNGTAAKKLKAAGEKRGHNVKIMNPDDMYIYISNVHRKDRLYLGEERIYSKDIDAVICRIGASRHGRVVINHMRQNMGIYTTQTVEGIANAADKLRTGQLLSLKGIKTPRTVFARSTKNPKLLIDLVGGLPIIAKTLTGSQGGGVVILETVLSANSVLESFYNKKIPVLIQEYIEPDQSGAKDIRVIVIGGKVITAMQRIAPKGSFKANVSLGASAEPVELTEAQKELSIKAAAAVGLDTCGVDLMTDKEGVNYVIESNSCHGFKISDVVKEDIAAAYIEFVEQNWHLPDQRDMITPIDTESRTHTPYESDVLEIRFQLHQHAAYRMHGLTGEARKRSIKNYVVELTEDYGEKKVNEALQAFTR